MVEVKRGLSYISDKNKERCIQEIIAYFQNERNEEIGVIAAESILDFFLENIAKTIYNKAIDDTSQFLKKQLEGLDFELNLLKRQ